MTAKDMNIKKSPLFVGTFTNALPFLHGMLPNHSAGTQGSETYIHLYPPYFTPHHRHLLLPHRPPLDGRPRRPRFEAPHARRPSLYMLELSSN